MENQASFVLNMSTSINSIMKTFWNSGY